MTDPYEILGVARTADDEELKKAYHALVRRHHPDRFAGDDVRQELANRKMREINAAYEAIVAARERGEEGKPSPPPPPPPEKKAEPPRGTAATGRPFLGYPYIRTLLSGGSFAAAYGELLHVLPPDRTAEWHYLAALSHRGLRHIHDALHEVGLACRLAPKNKEYRALREEMRHGAEEFCARAGTKSDTATPPKRKDSLCKKICFRLLGMEDGKC